MVEPVTLLSFSQDEGIGLKRLAHKILTDEIYFFASYVFICQQSDLLSEMSEPLQVLDSSFAGWVLFQDAFHFIVAGTGF